MDDRKEKIAELVSLIQQGQDEYLLQLWEEVNGLVKWYAVRCYIFLIANKGTTHVEIPDLEQSGYIAMVEALQSYDSTRGQSFSTYLGYYIKKAFRDLIGNRTSKRDALDYCVSLDAPIDDDEPESDTLHDIVADICADRTNSVNESIFLEQLHNALERALDAIPPKEAYALRAEYWRGQKQAETAREMNCSSQYIARLRNDGLRHIRTGPAKAQLERFLDSETPFFKSVSAERFNRTHTSAVEELVLWRDRRRREIGKSLCTT